MIKTILIVILTIAIATFNFITPVSATDLEKGTAIFQAHCAGCHANGGNIVRRGKNLRQKALKRNQLDNLAAVVELVTNGKNNMSAYRDRLTTQDIEEVSAYVLQQAANNWR
ncbi:MAG: c-type cytochrome [Pleurocapsa sp.]